MGGLKEQDPVISSTENVKKARGNPNLRKGARNPYYEKGTENTQEQKNMAEEAEVVSETKTTTPSSEMSGEKKVIPDDIFSDVIPEAEVLPLDGEVKVKDYATLADPNAPKVNGSGNGGGGGGNNIPPVTPGAESLGGGGTNTPLGDPTATVTPGAGIEGAKTPEQVKTEAEQFVKLLIRGYVKIHDLGRWAAKKDPKDLMILHQKRKINLDYNLPLGTSSITLRSFFADYNAQIEDDIVVTEEFKKEITPPLERIAIKKGWGMGDEGTVIMLLAEDIGTKGALLYGLLKTANMVLDAHMIMIKGQQDAEVEKSKPNENKKADTEDFMKEADNWRESDNSGVSEAQVVK